jgi:hypothetical protein
VPSHKSLIALTSPHVAPASSERCSRQPAADSIAAYSVGAPPSDPVRIARVAGGVDRAARLERRGAVGRRPEHAALHEVRLRRRERRLGGTHIHPAKFCVPVQRFENVRPRSVDAKTPGRVPPELNWP